MTLEERIESMLNKSKSNGITDGNKSKAEDTNFGDEADIADLLNKIRESMTYTFFIRKRKFLLYSNIRKIIFSFLQHLNCLFRSQ